MLMVSLTGMGLKGQWQVWVSFGSECRSVVCDWLVAVVN
ncbi:DNA primase [Nostoc sphaeroides CCNUC1]|uniref:DNA primase n=1 Tax=Nostoc sphaeroides CCNUC1 TaxID=2653204 RepID=A0A5P8WGQ4_9NOSO|nr:DNA primase [Nostoc sphaeroides CCNUC1]